MVCPNIYIMVYHHWHQCPEASPISIPAMTQVKARKLRGGGDDCPPKNTEDMIIICMYVFFFPTVHCCFTLRPVSRETEFKSGYIYISFPNKEWPDSVPSKTFQSTAPWCLPCWHSSRRRQAPCWGDLTGGGLWILVIYVHVLYIYIIYIYNIYITYNIYISIAYLGHMVMFGKDGISLSQHERSPSPLKFESLSWNTHKILGGNAPVGFVWKWGAPLNCMGVYPLPSPEQNKDQSTQKDQKGKPSAWLWELQRIPQPT